MQGDELSPGIRKIRLAIVSKGKGKSGGARVMITQGPEELNIIVGVEEKDFEQAIRVLYKSFVKENVV